ncbi:VWA domain-containing protein [Fibrobacterota bacterium]
MTIRNEIPGGDFSTTPLNSSIIVGLKYLINNGQGNNKSIIMLTDGDNYDEVSDEFTLNFIDSLYNNFGITLFTIGFHEGEPYTLRMFASAGGGQFFYAQDLASLDSVYNDIANQIIIKEIDTIITRTPILVPPDTLREPVDVLLAFDLSGSMNALDGTSKWRITWTQMAALEFLDSLNTGDRIGILGWTADGDNTTLADTSNPAVFYNTWFDFSSDIAAARAFIRNELYLDGDARGTDSSGGEVLVRQEVIPSGVFDDTPLNISAILGLKYLAEHSANPNKALILLTDGENDDNLTLGFTQAFVDSVYSEHGISLYTVGFEDGDTTALKALAQSGRGQFFYAGNPDELSAIYAQLSSIIYRNFAARNLLMQEVLGPNQTYIVGSQTTLPTSSVPVSRFEQSVNSGSQTVLQWWPDHVPVFGSVDVYYEVTIPADNTYTIIIPPADAPLEDDYSKVSYININDQEHEEGIFSVLTSELDLSGSGIDILPPEIAILTDLDVLDISDNGLTVLPPELGSLQDLDILDASDNQLTDVPVDIALLAGLDVLDLSNNQLTVLPPGVTALINLDTLDLSGNQLVSIPVGIGGMTGLDYLDISDNQLTDLPADIINIPNVTVNVNGNKLCLHDNGVINWLDSHAQDPNWRAAQSVDAALGGNVMGIDLPEERVEFKITIQHNQFTRSVNITFSDPSAYKALFIYDPRGRLIKAFKDIKHAVTWSTEGQGPGIFYFKAIGNDKRVVRKIVLQ